MKKFFITLMAAVLTISNISTMKAEGYWVKTIKKVSVTNISDAVENIKKGYEVEIRMENNNGHTVRVYYPAASGTIWCYDDL